jgi:outer membrane PBP1 activator LpoA protein
MKPRRLTPPAALLLAALAGCAGTAPSYSSSTWDSSGSPLDQAQKAQAHKDNFRAARAYEQAAQQASGSQASDYHLHAAEAAADGNDYSFASGILDALPLNGLEPEQQLRWRILRARVELARNDAAGALHLLPADNAGGSPLAEQVLLVRGRALFHLGDAVAATTALVQREHLLPPGLAAENHDTIWSGLTSTPLDSAALSRAGNADPVTRGWIELANLAHRNASLEQYESWRQRHPGHPGQDRLAGAMMPGPAPAYVQPGGPSPLQPAPAQPFATVPARPGFYALLLPQSGPLAGYAESLRAGFAAAAARAGNSADVRVYDPAGNVLNAYSQAVSEGAGVVIGPLLKNDVASLSQGGSSTPVLALNYLDYGHAAPPGFYQFGLAPEDEARAAAEDAVARGLRRALVLVPDNERGSRVLAAFQQRLGELGGEVRDSRRYSGEFESWQAPIASLLRYHPVADKKKLAELRAAAQPGVDVQRRNDFDFIFMDSGATQARQLWPLFRYYHAERMAIYDTAGVNEGRGDADLAGIRFCDAPWMLDNGGTWAALRGDALNGRKPPQARFFALGDDSFQLAQRLSQNSLHPLDELPGASGTLRVGDDGSIHRSLVCARTTEGEPQVLEAPGAGAQ